MGYPGKLFLMTSLGGALILHRLAPPTFHLGSLWSAFFILLLLQTFSYAAWSYVLWPKYFTPLRHLPQPKDGSFLMGQFKRINAEPSGYPMLDWSENVPNDGLIYYTTALNASRVLLTNAKALSEVLTNKSYEFVKPDQLREGLGRLLGVGILLAEGDEHKRQRKLLSPAFSFRHIKDLYPIFWAKGREMVIGMEEAISKPDSDTEKTTGVVDVGDWSSRTMLDIIGVSGMGKDFNSLQDSDNELFRTYKKVFSPSRTAQVLGLLTLIFPFWLVRMIPVQRNNDVYDASALIKRTAYNLIQDKKAKLEKGESDDVDILSVALKSGGFSDDDLVNQLMTFLAAGHETTASTMTWALLALCRNQDVQDRLREELQSAGVPSAHSDSAVAAADIENIPYLTAVCNEVLRLYPPVGLTLRKAANDTTILGHPIPKNTTVIISPYANNLSTDMWGPDAAQFNPERWMKPGCHNSGGAKSNYAFMTFLHGPRSCIGNGFAKAEFMCLLASWVVNFKTELQDPDRVIEIGGGVTSKPKGGLPVKLTRV